MSEIGILSEAQEIFSCIELRPLMKGKSGTILFIGTDWCSQSRSMAKVIAELSKEFPEINFLAVSLEDNNHEPYASKEEFKALFEIVAYPTLLAFAGSGTMPLEKLVSEKSLKEQEEDVRDLIKRCL